MADAKYGVLSADRAMLFRNSQGEEVSGVLMHLTRDSMVFEVYNPYSIVQLSEVLTDVRIRRGDRDIYTGKAMVDQLINTGLMLVVSAVLTDPWSDVLDLTTGLQLRDEVRRFVDDWTDSNRRLRPGYVHSVSSLRHFLQEFSRWLEHGEMLGGLRDPKTAPERVREFARDVGAVSMPRLGELFQQFEAEACQVADQELAVHKAFARREVHPLILCSPFVHRAYTKPLGYAGDYEMVNMMSRDPWEGASTYARLMNAFFLQNAAVLAHRFRLDRLVDFLAAEVQRGRNESRPCRVLNVACGPAVEVQRFVRDNPLADDLDMELIDFNLQTLEHTRQRITEIAREQHRRTRLTFTHLSVHDLLKQVSKRGSHVEPSYHFVYCAGLFDYLTDRICSRLLQLFYDWTLPGGLVVATNVHSNNPVRCCMEHLQEWSLILRDERQMLDLVPGLGVQRVSCEQTGVNVFLEIQKPTGQGAPVCLRP
jgi:extracellular factor (EF) 3-hydroxypalmitic acid methyl ester biosynthesis protein